MRGAISSAVWALSGVLFFGSVAVSHAQTNSGTTIASSNPAPEPNYVLPFDENWSFLSDTAKRSDVWDPLKYIPLKSGKTSEYLSVGAEFRGAYEVIQNDNFTQLPHATYGFGTQRFHLSLDGHINPMFRFFVQLESGEEEGRSGGHVLSTPSGSIF